MWRHIKNSNAIYRDRVARIWVSLEVWASPVSHRQLTITIVSANRIYEPCRKKNSLLGFRPKRAVQPQDMARGLKFRILEGIVLSL